MHSSRASHEDQGTEAMSHPTAPLLSVPRRLLCHGGFWTAVFTTANAALGAGVLAYPVAFRDSGMAGGTLLLFAFAITASLGLFTVLQCMSRTQATNPSVRDYTKMVSSAFGTKAEVGVTLLILLYVFGACWGYLVLLADTVTPMILKLHPTFNEGLTRSIIQIISTCISIGLCALRNINTLKYSSALAIAAVLTTVIMLVKNYVMRPCKRGDCTDAVGMTDWCHKGDCSGWCTLEQSIHTPERCPSGTEGVSIWPKDVDGLLRALPLIAFALQCHIQGAVVYDEMPTQLKSHPSASLAVAATSSILLVLLYLPTGLAGYAAFGAVTQGDILTNFASDDPLADVARGCIAITALCAYPMQHFPARLILHNVLGSLLQKQKERDESANDRSNMMSLSMPLEASLEQPSPEPSVQEPSAIFIWGESCVWCLLVLGLSLAAAGSSLSGVFSLVGALCGGNVIFTIPGALWLQIGDGNRIRRGVRAAPLLFMGGFVTIFGTYATIQGLVEGTR